MACLAYGPGPGRGSGYGCRSLPGAHGYRACCSAGNVLFKQTLRCDDPAHRETYVPGYLDIVHDGHGTAINGLQVHQREVIGDFLGRLIGCQGMMKALRAIHITLRATANLLCQMR